MKPILELMTRREFIEEIERLNLIIQNYELCFDAMKPMHDKEFEVYQKWMQKTADDLQEYPE